jgi:hypothetical protein
MPQTMRLPVLLSAAAALALAACGQRTDANLVDLNAGNDADPALTSALEDQILVDPELAQQANRTAVRPADTPPQSQYPAAAPGAQPAATPASATPVSGQPRADAAGGVTAPAASRGAGGLGAVACGGTAAFDYNAAWARRLPQPFALYPAARLSEAAGSNAGACEARVVTFTSGEGHQRILDWYHSRAVRGGYSSEHQVRGGDHILGGVHPSGAAFLLIVTPAGKGAEAALIVNNGR